MIEVAIFAQFLQTLRRDRIMDSRIIGDWSDEEMVLPPMILPWPFALIGHNRIHGSGLVHPVSPSNLNRPSVYFVARSLFGGYTKDS